MINMLSSLVRSWDLFLNIRMFRKMDLFCKLIKMFFF
jgi:hypothetical protein